MKSIFTNLFFFLICFGLSAQGFYVSFQPKESGTPIDSIRVTNLATGQQVKMAGNESLLLTTTTAVISSSQQEFLQAYLYPNPAEGDASLFITCRKEDLLTAGLLDASGRFLSRISLHLSSGSHRLLVRFPASGLYFLTIQTSEGSQTVKAVSTGRNQQEGQLLYTGKAADQVERFALPVKSATAEKSMTYKAGEVLHYSAFSASNNVILTDAPVSTRVYTLEFVGCTDFEKQSYPVVKIGTQWWMAANLRSAKYRDGSTIPQVSVNSEWAALTTGAWCWYSNNESLYKNSYGAIYNWFATTDSRNLCPAGWHVPTDAEWTTLETYLIANGYNFDGKLSENNIGKSLATTTKWDTCTIYKGAVGNTDFPGTRNKTGFSALPGGGRAANGLFDIAGSWGMWWSSTSASASEAWARYLGNTETSLDRFTDPKKVGYSVRCIKD